jgi:diacylglycerol kinase family enzyme
MGQTGVNLVPGASVSDGLLDVVVVQQANLRALFDILGSITGMKQVQAENTSDETNSLNMQMQQNLRYWQGKEVALIAEPEQSVQYDGEVLGKVGIKCNVIPQAVHVLTPALVQPTPAA